MTSPACGCAPPGHTLICIITGANMNPPRTLATRLEAAERDAYRDALARHGGSITEAARELDVSRVTASRAVDRLGLRAWLDEAYPHRDPATVGRKGESRKRPNTIEKQAE